MRLLTSKVLKRVHAVVDKRHRYSIRLIGRILLSTAAQGDKRYLYHAILQRALSSSFSTKVMSYGEIYLQYEERWLTGTTVSGLPCTATDIIVIS